MIVLNLNLSTRNLNERDKVCKCYSCLKMMIQAQIHTSFFTNFSLNEDRRFNLYMKLLQSSTIFKQKIYHEMSCD